MTSISSCVPVQLILVVALMAAASGCGEDPDRLFELLDSGRTGVDFVNAIVPDDTLMNPLDFFYVYNGGGVAVADFNEDGWPDLYFTGNQVGNRLYLNRGDFRFVDVTTKAGVAADGAWSTGVAVIDVNQDGLQDLYVCVGGPTSGKRRANLLYVNNGVDADGVPSFQERAERYGIADTGYATHAAFFDYDRDGDLDLYVLNTAMVREAGEPRRPLRRQRRDSSKDRLYRNDGGHGSGAVDSLRFTDVSEAAGIRHEGFGLGVAVGDINQDGWPDVYVANDFISKDLLYVNNGDGTFTNRSVQMLRHQSYSSMGMDLADFDNDARLDIIVLDMLPKDPVRQRVTSNASVLYEGELQYGRNTLQLNNGTGPSGQPLFSDIAHLAGVAATDWSWAPLFADLDNDGDRDLFVSNGYGELVTHLDFLDRRQQLMFSGTPEENRRTIMKQMKELPVVRIPNDFFENLGAPGSSREQHLTFADRTGAWSVGRPSLSNGAAYADLDRDGDLDLVTNNVNEEAFVLRNNTSEAGTGNALRVTLHGPAGNRAGIGAKLTLRNGGSTQYVDHSPYRGYQSTVESVVHFGLDADSTADSLHVLWPDGAFQLLTDVKADHVVEVHHRDATIAGNERPLNDPYSLRKREPYLFRDVAAATGLRYEHIEYAIADFSKTPLLPHQYSRNGPGLAVGDADGNGLDDVFIGADPGRVRKLFLQTAPGRFTVQTLPMETVHEDLGALFFDADSDGDLDLYIVSGGSAAPADDGAYQDRLYVNDGTGQFSLDTTALPNTRASGSSVTAGDYDGDGDLDLFVGGRVRPGSYPLPPRSYLLRNDISMGRLRFSDVTEAVAPGLSDAGLVTSALWTDFNSDDRLDLVVVGEWMPITLFQNVDGRFIDVTQERGLGNTSGWWNSLTAGDFDSDGDVDYVAGNLGLNTRYTASPSEPVRVHAKDYDGDGRLDPVLSYYMQGTSYPAHGRDEISKQILGMLRRFPSYQDYAEASFDEVLKRRDREGAFVAEAVRFETSYIENRGDGTFDIRALPIRTQVAPIFGMRAADYVGDDNLDLLVVGNWYAPDVETGRADAFPGAVLRGDGTGRFFHVESSVSGFVVEGDAKAIAEVATGIATSLVLVTQNGGQSKAFAGPARGRAALPLEPLDRYALLTLRDGSTRRIEFYYGSTYLSQSSRVLWIPSGVEAGTLVTSDGRRRALNVEEAGLAASTAAGALH